MFEEAEIWREDTIFWYDKDIEYCSTIKSFILVYSFVNIARGIVIPASIVSIRKNESPGISEFTKIFGSYLEKNIKSYF